jgi:hypothetical protein
MMDMVSQAMTSGKTKALSLALGINDIDTATKEYADSLGVEVSQLSNEGQAQARRLHVMELLNNAVKDAGVQQRDFGEQIEFAKTQLINWSDRLGSAIAQSPALAAGMQAVADAIGNAFGSDNQDSIDKVLEGIKQAAIIAVDFGLGMIEAARVVNVAWSAVKVIILGTETAFMGFAATIDQVIASILKVASSLPGASQSLKDMAAAQQEAADNTAAMTKSLADQTAEAAKGLAGASEFDKTLDELGGTMMGVRDAIENADASLKKDNATTDIAAANASKLAAATKVSTDRMIDRQKIEDALWKTEEKSLKETAANWDTYFSMVAKGSGTTFDAMRADIEATFNKQVAALDATDRNFAENYASIKAIHDQALKGMSSDWDSVKDKSIEALNETARVAEETYIQMQTGSLHFSREVMEEQRQKVEETRNAARGLGKDYDDAMTLAADKAAKVTEELEKQQKVADALAAANRAMGGSMDVTKANFNKAGSGDTIMGQSKNAIWPLLEEGFSLQNAIAILQAGMDWHTWKGERGPRVPGFREGGLVMVGEGGPEAVRLPFGSEVYKNGTPASGMGRGGGHVINIHSGAIVLQYPVVNNPRDLDRLADVAGEAFLRKLQTSGAL